MDRFFADIIAGRYRAAYDSLTKAGRDQQSFEEFQVRARTVSREVAQPVETGMVFVITGRLAADSPLAVAACPLPPEETNGDEARIVPLTAADEQTHLELLVGAGVELEPIYAVVALDHGSWRLASLTFFATLVVLGDQPDLGLPPADDAVAAMEAGGNNSRPLTQMQRPDARRMARARTGSAHDKYLMGVAFDEGGDVEYDPVEARRWYLLAARAGDPDGQFRIAEGLLDGILWEVDVEQGLRWLRKAADQGHGGALGRLAREFDEGVNIARDHAEAVRLYRRGADAGGDYARTNLAVNYATGDGVPQDYAEALRLLKLAAPGAYPEAAHNLGVLYDQGMGTPVDEVEANRWYAHAAAAGLPISQSQLGRRYLYGFGGAPDPARGLRLLRLAARRHDARALNDLGWAYLVGAGVKSDANVALRLLTEAADRGDPDALFHLGEMYERGLGVTADRRTAFIWYQRAALSTPQRSERRTEAQASRDRVAALLSETVRAAAVAEADAWEPVDENRSAPRRYPAEPPVQTPESAPTGPPSADGERLSKTPRDH